MARIRSVKPDFFRHEGLQKLGPIPMLVFEGLWTQADGKGRFLWRPKTLHLDILPFLEFDMAKTLEVLASDGFVTKYAVGGREYGIIPSFNDHQRIGGKEAQEPSKYPDPPAQPIKPKRVRRSAAGKQQGSDGEAPGKHLVAQELELGNGIGKGDGKGEEWILRDDPRDEKKIRDGIWDGMCKETGFNPVSKGERSRLGRIVSDLVAKGALPEDVPIRARRYRQLYRGMPLTINALFNNWDTLGRDMSTGLNGSAVDKGQIEATMKKVLQEESDADV